jgi:hypothetical protein
MKVTIEVDEELLPQVTSFVEAQRRYQNGLAVTTALLLLANDYMLWLEKSGRKDTEDNFDKFPGARTFKKWEGWNGEGLVVIPGEIYRDVSAILQSARVPAQYWAEGVER